MNSNSQNFYRRSNYLLHSHRNSVKFPQNVLSFFAHNLIFECRCSVMNMRSRLIVQRFQCLFLVGLFLLWIPPNVIHSSTHLSIHSSTLASIHPSIRSFLISFSHFPFIPSFLHLRIHFKGFQDENYSHVFRDLLDFVIISLLY